MATYAPLEPSNLQDLVGNTPTYNGSDFSLFTVSTFLYTLLFSAIIAAAFYRYTVAGLTRIQASEASIRKSNEIFKTVSLGLLGVFSLFLILFTVNKDLVTGDVGLEKLKTGGVVAVGGSNGTTQDTSNHSSSGGSVKTCEQPSTIINNLSSSGGLCGNATCNALTNCNYEQYLPYIDKEIGNDAKLRKMVIVIMCKESKAKANSENQNGDSFDCGLMQINQKTKCDQAILDPATNIQKGVSLLREKIRMSRQIYPGVPDEASVFASYNCCANGTPPNAESVDCTKQNGFPSKVPKWACPINPGESSYNMCSVKSYACELTSCLNSL
jgi:hypothetical protein